MHSLVGRVESTFEVKEYSLGASLMERELLKVLISG